VAVITSLYKGKVQEPSAVVTLLSVPGKVFDHVLLERLQPLLTRQRRQQRSGFMRSLSTIYPILALRLLAELHREFRKPLHVAYIDIKAAFNSVDRRALWKVFHAIGAPQFLIRLIHTAQRHEFESGGSCRKLSTLPRVCAKGVFLHQHYYYLAIDWIMFRCSGSLGVTLGEAVLTDLNYAMTRCSSHKIQEGGRQNSNVSTMLQPP